MDDLVKIARNHASRPDGYYMEDWAKMADRIEALEKAYAQQQQVWSDAIARADRYEAALWEVYEVYAGSEGIPQPMTAAEGYLLRLAWEMANTARAALGEKKDVG